MASRVAHMGQQQQHQHQQRGGPPVDGNHSDTTPSFHSNMNTHHYHHQHQHATGPEKMQSNQISENERRTRELRALAYEYVKQIVTKANELSQPPQSGHNRSQITEGRAANNRFDAHNASRIPLIGSDSPQGQTNRRLVDEAAIQINERFKFPGAVNSSAQSRGEASAGSSVADQVKSSKLVTYHNGQNNPIFQDDNRPSCRAQITPVRPAENLTTTKTKTTPITSTSEIPSRAAHDYIEQDYATMTSSSQDENESLARGGARRADNQTKTRGAGGRSWATGGGSSSASGAHFPKCFSWHLLVSCLSACLPETLKRHTTSANMGPSAV